MTEQKKTPGGLLPLTKEMIGALTLPRQNHRAPWKEERKRLSFLKRREDVRSRREQKQPNGGWWFWDQVHIQEQKPDQENYG